MDNKIYGLYKRIMKRVPNAIDEIETLEEAKEIIKMMTGNIYLREHDETIRLVRKLEDVASVFVRESAGKITRIKNRYGYNTEEAIKEYTFSRIKFSELIGKDPYFIARLYYEQKVWLLMDE